MNKLLFLLFLCLFSLSTHGEAEVSVKNKTSLKVQDKQKPTDQSPSMEGQNPQTTKTLSTQPTGIITQKIKKIFEDFVEILEKKNVESSEYIKAVKFLENSLYNEASFGTLKLLAEVYEQKKDFKNQINVLKNLSINYSNKPESFYLLSMAYKNLYLNEKDDQIKKCKIRRSICKSSDAKSTDHCKEGYQECLVENKKKSIENLNQALKLNRKYTVAYESLLDLLIDKNPETGGKVHTKESLSLIIEMLKNLRENKYYIQLCKAYYENNFLKQSQKACARSIKRNPDDPISPLILALSRPDDKNMSQKLVNIASRFQKSFFVQYKTALYFMDKNSKSAIFYLNSAHTLQPENMKLNQMMARYLFDNKEEEKSYKHFLIACQLTEGQFLKDFKKAKSALRKKQMVDLILKFQKGIDQCFSEVRKKKRDKK